MNERRLSDQLKDIDPILVECIRQEYSTEKQVCNYLLTYNTDTLKNFPLSTSQTIIKVNQMKDVVRQYLLKQAK